MKREVKDGKSQRERRQNGMQKDINRKLADGTRLLNWPKGKHYGHTNRAKCKADFALRLQTRQK